MMKQSILEKSLIAAIIMALIFLGATTLMSAKDNVAQTDKINKINKNERGYLGVAVELLAKDTAETKDIKHGVVVASVTEGEAAEKAGIKKGDIIQYFNDETIRRPSNLIAAVGDCQPGQKVKVKLLREGKEKEFTVTLGKLKHKSYAYHYNFDDADREKRHKELFVKKFNDKDFKKRFKKEFFVASHGFMGVYLESLEDADLAEYFGVKEGALIKKVSKDTPADKAGLKAGDVIVKMGDTTINSDADVHKFMRNTKKGDKVAVHIKRHKKNKTVTVEVDEREDMKFMGLNNFPRSGMFKKGDKNLFWYGDNEPHIRIGDKEIKLEELKELEKLKELKELKELKGLEGKEKLLKLKELQMLKGLDDMDIDVDVDDEGHTTITITKDGKKTVNKVKGKTHGCKIHVDGKELNLDELDELDELGENVKVIRKHIKTKDGDHHSIKIIMSDDCCDKDGKSKIKKTEKDPKDKKKEVIFKKKKIEEKESRNI